MSDELVAKVTTLSDLLDFNGMYIVPDYQRPYSWEKSHIESFVSDISINLEFDAKSDLQERKGYITGINGDDYFIGTIILSSCGVKDNRIALEIIDGQQRTVTTFITMNVLKRYFKENESIVLDAWENYYTLLQDASKEEISDDFKNNILSKLNGKSTFELKDEDKKALLAVSKQIEYRREKSDSDRVWKNFCNIKDALAENASNMRRDYGIPQECYYIEFAWSLIRRVKFIRFEVLNQQANGKNRMDAIINIFNVVNTRGLPVTQGTVLWNLIYKELNDDQNKEKLATTLALIKTLEDDYEENKYDIIEQSLMSYYVAENKNRASGKIVGIGTEIIRNQFHKFYEFMNSSLELSIILNKAKLSNSNDMDKDLSFALSLINEISHDSALFTLLYALHGLNKLNTKVIIDICKYAWFMHLKEFGMDNRRKFYTEKYIKCISDGEFAQPDGFSRDNLFLVLTESEIYKSKGVSRSIIRAMMNIRDFNEYGHYSSEEQSYQAINKFTIEHILPQNPQDKKISEQCHKLGNLVPLSQKLNSSVKNKSFEEKIKLYKTSSGIINDLKVMKKWGDEEILERSKSVATSILDHFDKISNTPTTTDSDETLLLRDILTDGRPKSVDRILSRYNEGRGFPISVEEMEMKLAALETQKLVIKTDSGYKRARVE